jgi:hypothetical protein
VFDGLAFVNFFELYSIYENNVPYLDLVSRLGKQLSHIYTIRQRQRVLDDL